MKREFWRQGEREMQGLLPVKGKKLLQRVGALGTWPTCHMSNNKSSIKAHKTLHSPSVDFPTIIKRICIIDLEFLFFFTY